MKILSLSSIFNAAELIISWFIGYLQVLVDYNASLYSVTERFFKKINNVSSTVFPQNPKHNSNYTCIRHGNVGFIFWVQESWIL